MEFIGNVTVRLACFTAFLLLATHAPLFSCYGAGTGKNKVRIAPASYFVFGVEQMDAVKKNRRLTGMAHDLGTALHALNELAEDYGVPQALAEIGQYVPIWKSRAKRLQASRKERERESAGKKKRKKTKRKNGRSDDNYNDDARKPFMVRARKWREELDEVKKIAKGDYLGVAAAGIVCLSSFMILLTPGAGQFVLIGIVGMMTGVTRQNLPNMTMERPFMIVCGLLVFVIILQSFWPDSEDNKKSGKKNKRKKGPSMRRPKA